MPMVVRGGNGSGSLPPGGRGVLRLGTEPICRYDGRATYAHGGELTRFGLDLCTSTELALSDDDLSTPLPPVRDGIILYRVTNRTGGPVVALHAWPSGGGAVRGDLLGAWAWVTPCTPLAGCRPLAPAGTI